MRAYWITNLAIQQLVHTLTDISNCFQEYLPAHLPNPAPPTPFIPNHPFTFLPWAKKLWMEKWVPDVPAVTGFSQGFLNLSAYSTFILQLPCFISVFGCREPHYSTLIIKIEILNH